MNKKYEEDLDSVKSLEDSETSDIEVETKSKRPSKKQEPEVRISKRTGKPVRELSEKQKQNIVKARKKAREVRERLKQMTLKEKEIKKDSLLLRELELAKKIKEHKDRLKNLACDAGLADESLRPKPKRKPYTHKPKEEDDDYEKSKKSEIEELKRQLKELQKKHNIKAQIESDDEIEVEEEEEEEEEKKVVEVKRAVVKKPVMKKVEKVPNIDERKRPPNPMERDNIGDIRDKKLQQAMLQLFS